MKLVSVIIIILLMTMSVVMSDCAVTELDIVNPLKYIKAAIAIDDGGELKCESYFRELRPAHVLEDSGAELAVVSPYVLQQLEDIVPMGWVLLSGISGTPVECPLVRLEVWMLQRKCVITCAVLDQSVDELVLPIAVIDHLCSMGGACNECVADVLIIKATEKALEQVVVSSSKHIQYVTFREY